MKILVTGSSGHLGEALVRTLKTPDHDIVGLDINPSLFTTEVGSVLDRDCIKRCMRGAQTVYHTATLHKPHIATHSMQDFIDTNIAGTLALLEAAVDAGVKSFVFTSTTSTFGDALRPPPEAPAVWVTEDIQPVPRNIYGVTKTAAEELCHLFHRTRGLNCLILRTSRFFAEADDDASNRAAFDDRNIKANELLFRRVDIEDVVSAHLLAGERAQELGFGRYIISATTPFQPEDLAELRRYAPGVVEKRVPGFTECYQRMQWRMFDSIERVYVNDAARRDLGWQPKYDFAHVLQSLRENADYGSPLSRLSGAKGYHEQVFDEGPYPVE